jgi:cysteine-rich repeat protein
LGCGPSGSDASDDDRVFEPPSVCGNFIVEGNEVCDDGNRNDGDYCDASCRVSGGRCGDGIKQDFEPCERTLAERGTCSGYCELLPVCGNGVTERTPSTHAEGCDDGNLLGGDGCDASCKTERGWGCTGETSECGLKSELMAKVLDPSLSVQSATADGPTWNALCRWWIAMFDPGFDGLAACSGTLFDTVRISADDCGPMLRPVASSCDYVLGDLARCWGGLKDACEAKESCEPAAICAWLATHPRALP